MSWRPSASLHNLRHRAQFLQDIRTFFAARNVMEVESPLLYSGVATDPGLNAFAIGTRFLQTSPEFPMKRLIAAGSGPIYSLGKAFRCDEVGARHNPEFTMLEWYRPSWDHFQLIEEVDALFQTLLGCQSASLTTYAALFEHYFNINPHIATLSALESIAMEGGWLQTLSQSHLDKDGLLDLLLTHGIEPELGYPHPTVIVDYPASQASLSKIRTIEGDEPYEVAERFEFYYRGIELANGYHELSCPKEQKQRFLDDLQKREAQGLPILPLDNALIAALEAGFGPCAGVAIGVDRLLMLKLQENHIANVLPFAWDKA